MEHENTGAKVLHLHCDDRENLYAIGFRTPPTDSTGVPHILEHSVLAGSEKFPLKDAFNELHKGTLQTFINAFTYPDKTIYPVASQVRNDFFNLARVYTDLVLRPRLLKESFYQEGHHLEFADPDNQESDLTISGIVYNEMKGAYSSPDTLMFKAIQENLFPDNAYAHDSGGDPEAIPGSPMNSSRNSIAPSIRPATPVFSSTAISRRKIISLSWPRCSSDSTASMWIQPSSTRNRGGNRGSFMVFILSTGKKNSKARQPSTWPG